MGPPAASSHNLPLGGGTPGRDAGGTICPRARAQHPYRTVPRHSCSYSLSLWDRASAEPPSRRGPPTAVLQLYGSCFIRFIDTRIEALFSWPLSEAPDLVSFFLVSLDRISEVALPKDL
eukprot:COSAG01_NODE_5723_length_4074_cov_49.724277_6_plen_119_part_00